MATDIKNDPTLSTGLVSYWKLDEASGVREDIHGANDIADSGTIDSTTGKINNAALFVEANSDYGVVSDNASLQNLNAYSFNFWIKSNTTGMSADTHLVSIDAAGRTAGDFRIQMDGSDHIQFVMDTGAADNIATGTTDIIDNTWHMVTITGDGSNINIYIDGDTTPEDTEASTIDANQASRAWYFGVRYLLINADYFDGALDEFGLWSKALSTDEITDLWNGGDGLPYEAAGAVVNVPTLLTLGVG